MSKGIVILAKNNETFDYIRQAEVAASYAKHFLKVPATLITDTNFNSDVFDTIIQDDFESFTPRAVYSDTKIGVSYFNSNRKNVFHLSPYDETIVIDSDYIVRNDILSAVWGSLEDFMINTTPNDLMGNKSAFNDLYIVDGGLPVFWATAFYFKKSEFISEYSNILDTVVKDYEYYFRLFGQTSTMFRNDYAFSIAYHLLHGSIHALPPSLPTTQINVDTRTKLTKVRNKTHFEFTKDELTITSRRENVHIMDKFSLDKHLEDLMGVLDE